MAPSFLAHSTHPPYSISNLVVGPNRPQGGRASHKYIANVLGKSVKSEKELKATIDLMAAGGAIKIQPVRPPAGGAAAVWYAVG
jgi:hypothetical protein